VVRLDPKAGAVSFPEGSLPADDRKFQLPPTRYENSPRRESLANGPNFACCKKVFARLLEKTNDNANHKMVVPGAQILAEIVCLCCHMLPRAVQGEGYYFLQFVGNKSKLTRSANPLATDDIR
jgi:hypothetical protein